MEGVIGPTFLLVQTLGAQLQIAPFPLWRLETALCPGPHPPANQPEPPPKDPAPAVAATEQPCQPESMANGSAQEADAAEKPNKCDAKEGEWQAGEPVQEGIEETEGGKSKARDSRDLEDRPELAANAHSEGVAKEGSHDKEAGSSEIDAAALAEDPDNRSVSLMP